jgi:Bacterial Ig-like domain (group 3)/ParB/Sulfiredoxin domain
MGATEPAVLRWEPLVAQAPAVMVAVNSLRVADSPRLEGESSEHVQVLADSPGLLPPVLVHRPSMQIIDGMHRLQAAVMRGEDKILAQFLDCDERDIFVIAVQANTTHGLPLSLAERKQAAARIIGLYPHWSDRLIASAAGLSHKTVAALRPAATGDSSQLQARTGHDGRVRPLSSAAGRKTAGHLLMQNPGASLQQVASAAGISPGTVRDVRDRLARGQDPVPAERARCRAVPTNADRPQMGSRAGRPGARGSARTDGTWGAAAEVAGMNSITAVSCASAGDCIGVGGVLITSSDHAYVVAETDGTWGTATEVPGLSWLGDSDGSESRSISCTASGYCSLGGDYSYPDGSSVVDSTHNPFVADEANGTWHDAQAVPGAAVLNADNLAVVTSVSCAAAEYCSAGGYYYDSSGHSQAFVANEMPVLPTVTTMSLSAVRVVYGHEQSERVSVAVSAALGTPVGKVTVKSGSDSICTVTLTSGHGSCTVPATKFRAGPHTLTASYRGDAGFTASTSPAKTFTVARAASKTALTLSAHRVTYRHEQAERLTVKVTPQYAGTPAGKVTVKTGSSTICVITLASGKGTCTLAKQLRPGTYHPIASFAGSPNFKPSTSTRVTLTVLK